MEFNEKGEFHELLRVLQSVGFPLQTEILNKYDNIQQLPGEDFLRIVACIGNHISTHFLKRETFPKIYSREKNRIYPKDREDCLKNLDELAKHLEFQNGFSKNDIISALSRNVKKRADFLIVLRIYWQQLFAITPTRPVRRPLTPQNHKLTPTSTNITPRRMVDGQFQLQLRRQLFQTPDFRRTVSSRELYRQTE